MRKRGLTILEAILATVILAMVSLSVAATVGHLQRMAERGKLRSHAYETANRIMLQWLDDETHLPDANLPYDDGMYQFRWKVEVKPLEVTVPSEAMVQPPTDGMAARLFTSQRLVTVEVYQGFPDGHGGSIIGDERLAILKRTHNPQSKLAGRNPDSTKRIAQDQQRLTEQMANILGGGRPTATPPAGAAGAPR
ncbi:hypothetical protein BH11PLA1_BH11PLA1_15080 [soil metagenome]